MNSEDNTGSWRDRAVLSMVVSCAWLVAVVISSLISAGGFDPEFYGLDEPAHFVTGVMVYEYLRSGAYLEPMAFAEDFYLHYPKVAFGHWPPLFHVVQGLWYCVLGASKTSAIALVGVTAAATALSLYLWLLQRFGNLIAVATSTLFLLMPIPRLYTTRVMSEMLVTLLCFLAFWALNSAFETRRWARLVLFGLFAMLALFTKENALPILLTLPLAVVATGQFGLLRNFRVWLAIVSLGIAGLCFARVMLYRDHGWHGSRSFSDLFSSILSSVDPTRSIWNHLQIANPIVLSTAALGIVNVFSSMRKGDRRSISPAAVAAAWLVASVIFFAALSFFESRYLIPTLLPVLVLFAYGLDGVYSFVKRESALRGNVAILAIGLVAILTSIEKLPERTMGFSEVARSIPRDEKQPLVLIAADPRGDGSFIAERMIFDDKRTGFVLRADKLLSSSSWSGHRYQLKYQTPEMISATLDQLPINFVVFDHQAWIGSKPEPHHSLLLEALTNSPEQFVEIASFPIVRNGVTTQNAISVYRNQAAMGDFPGQHTFNMQHTLRRSTNIDFQDRRKPNQPDINDDDN